MKLYDEIKRLLLSEGIKVFAPISLSDCVVTKKYLLDRVRIETGTVIICAVPYLSPLAAGDHNISSYCSVRDYHKYFELLWSKICKELSVKFPENKFAGFADHSPIDERHAALHAGIGIMGDNGMIITDKHSSYVFLGELITDAEIECSPVEPQRCIGCGRCRSACPMTELGECLSAVTQKKGELSEKEASTMIKHNTAWGCDICQKLCPYTEKALRSGEIFTNIDYFLSEVIPDLDEEILNALDDEAFASRAFSWRGRQTVARNLNILEKKQ